MRFPHVRTQERFIVDRPSTALVRRVPARARPRRHHRQPGDPTSHRRLQTLARGPSRTEPGPDQHRHSRAPAWDATDVLRLGDGSEQRPDLAAFEVGVDLRRGGPTCGRCAGRFERDENGSACGDGGRGRRRAVGGPAQVHSLAVSGHRAAATWRRRVRWVPPCITVALGEPGRFRPQSSMARPAEVRWSQRCGGRRFARTVSRSPVMVAGVLRTSAS